MDAFYALAEPRRRRIIEILAANGSLPATDICKKFDITAQAISQHLRVMLDAKLLKVERRAQQRIYQINPDSMLEIEQWSAQMKRQWEGRFQRLDQLLEAEKAKTLKHR